MIKYTDQVHVHFIGIGGIGMSGIAEVLLSMGYRVSGSDMNQSATTDKLTSLGATVYKGHQRENLKDATVLVYSSAIDPENPEMMEAKERNIPIMRRAEMLAELMRLKKGIAVAGTHGKTTTTSILATILKESAYDPTYIIGGIVANLDGHARVGTGEYLVAEADESDGSFLLLNPVLSVITNIDNDHLDHYKTEQNLFNAFVDFANKVPFYGLCAMNAHDERVKELISSMKKPYQTFGIRDLDTKVAADYIASNLRSSEEGTYFNLEFKGGDIGEYLIKTPGIHNVLNALGAISIAHFLGVDFEAIRKGIKEFDGVGRRFQTLHKKDKFEVIDDYGHHPTEVATTIKTLRDARKGKEVVVIFEPHRFSRTRDCWDQFLHSFNDADQVFMAPIYPASEKPIPGISSLNLANDINKLHPDRVNVMETLDELDKVMEQYKNANSVVLTLGAGTIGRKVREWVKSIG